jgi:uncharacterized RDD family membrane protein YckC
MARWHRSSDGPVPYGPPPPGSAAPPETEAAPEDTAAWDVPSPPEPSPRWPATPPRPQLDPGPPPPPSPLGAPPPIAPWAPPADVYANAVPGAQGLQYGRTLDRVMAYWLDGIIVAIPTLIIAFVLGGGAAAVGLRTGGASLVAGIVATGIHLLYFVGFWTGQARATPGMRLMKLQIGDAKTGATLTVQQGLIRWLVLGGLFQVLEVIPVLAAVGLLAGAVWTLVLLATTATSPTKQGAHDRIADTALVQPLDARTPAVTCLVIVIGLFILWMAGIVALVFLGAQVSTILSTVGESV